MQHHEKELVRIRWRDIVLYGWLSPALLGIWLVLSGCMDVAHWQTRTFYGLDCRQEKLVNGQCVPVKKGDPHVKTVQP
jgi:hypothetical protein